MAGPRPHLRARVASLRARYRAASGWQKAAIGAAIALFFLPEAAVAVGAAAAAVLALIGG